MAGLELEQPGPSNRLEGALVPGNCHIPRLLGLTVGGKINFYLFRTLLGWVFLLQKPTNIP